MSSYILPVILICIVVAGIYKKAGIFDCFLSGARDGIDVAVRILPTLVGMLTAISMLRASGVLDLVAQAVSPVAQLLGLPEEVVPLALLRPVSGSGGIALLQNIFDTSGPDSFAGRVASVIAGATETTFYTIAVYYGAVGIKNTRHTVPAAITADIAGIVASGFAVRLLLGV